MVLASQSLNIGCPDDETLEQFKVGLLTEQDLEAVAAHLAVCSSCEARLAASERSKPDPLVQQIRKCVAEAPDLGISLSSLLRSLSSRRPASDGSSAETIDDKHTPEATEAEPEAPRLAHYELRELLGAGGMGQVYLAWDTKLKRTVALKVIKAKSHTAQNALARFHREAKAIAKLDHPGIVKLYDFGETEGVDYLCMEHVEGGSLHQKLKADHKPTYREAAELVRDLALAMYHAHQQNIIHRDLKPGNILLTPEGKPKIADFGLAKMLDEADTLTRTNVVVGTPIYMSPEQASGDAQRVAPLSDQYALGVILYEILTGMVPFRGKDNRETLARVQTARLLPPSTLRPDVPQQLETICLRALSRDPRDRYANTQELAEDLSRYEASKPLRPEPLLRRIRRSKWTKRVATSALFACLLLSACVIYATVTTPNPEAKLREYEAAMAAGQPIELIGENGYPGWMRWELGGDKARFGLAADRTFVLHSWDKCLLELLPKVDWPSYRIRARVKHVEGGRPGRVGIYFARTLRPGLQGQDFLAYNLIYNEVFDLRTIASQHPVTGNIQGPNSNFVELNTRIYSRIEGNQVITQSVDGPRGGFISTSSHGEVCWRQLEVLVQDGAVTASFDGQGMPSWSQTAWRSRVSEKLRDMHDRLPQFYAADPGIVTYQPSGAIGIYADQSSIAVSKITLEPAVDN